MAIADVCCQRGCSNRFDNVSGNVAYALQCHVVRTLLGLFRFLSSHHSDDAIELLMSLTCDQLLEGMVVHKTRREKMLVFREGDAM